MTGTPWHYEYGKSEGKYDSTNCVFNIGYCSCKASLNHKKECVGKLDCDDFERQMRSSKRKDLKKVKLKNQNSIQQQNPSYKNSKKKKNPNVISTGDNIIVAHFKTNEQINIPVRDSKNPFVGKRLHEIVTIKGEMYSIRKIVKSSPAKT